MLEYKVICPVLSTKLEAELNSLAEEGWILSHTLNQGFIILTRTRGYQPRTNAPLD